MDFVDCWLCDLLQLLPLSEKGHLTEPSRSPRLNPEVFDLRSAGEKSKVKPSAGCRQTMELELVSMHTKRFSGSQQKLQPPAL